LHKAYTLLSFVTGVQVLESYNDFLLLDNNTYSQMERAYAQSIAPQSVVPPIVSKVVPVIAWEALRLIFYGLKHTHFNLNQLTRFAGRGTTKEKILLNVIKIERQLAMLHRLYHQKTGTECVFNFIAPKQAPNNCTALRAAIDTQLDVFKTMFELYKNETNAESKAMLESGITEAHEVLKNLTSMVCAVRY